jgi:arachidonate 15-lipoxygenase
MLKQLPFPDLIPRLPQKDLSNQEKRQAQLNRNRRAYQYDHAFWSPMPLLNTAHQGLPFAEWMTIPYLVTRILSTIKLPINQTLTRLWALWDRVDQLQDYEDFFRFLPKPNVIETMQAIPDEMFAEQRLSGSNPMVIRQLTEIPLEWGFTIQDLRAALEPYAASMNGSVDVGKEFASGNLYVADYALLSFVKSGSYLRNRQYLPAPRAFFYYRKAQLHDGLRLAPIAIQMNPKRGKSSPFITPAHPEQSWNYAKLCVQIADANHHEMISHLCYTHLVMEPFAITTARQLGKNHPLGLLLRPHFRFLLANGELARSRLLGYIDRLLPGELKASVKLIKKGYKAWSFRAFAFPTEIENRGMNAAPYYPYRDDGKLLWDAIYEFVKDYLEIYYKTSEDIQGDTELQAWVAELAAQDGGRVKDMEQQITNIKELIDIVTNIIFTCGPQHSALNYSQYEYMTYMPNMPLSLYQPVREDAFVRDQNSFMPCLPPRTQAAEQLAILYILSLPYYYDKLGYYKRPFVDPCAQKCVTRFQERLKEIESKCSLYPYLNPNRITNSISM